MKVRGSILTLMIVRRTQYINVNTKYPSLCQNTKQNSLFFFKFNSWLASTIYIFVDAEVCHNNDSSLEP